MRLYRKLIRPVYCYPSRCFEPKFELIEKEEKWYPEEERESLEKKYAYYNEGSFNDLVFEEKYEPIGEIKPLPPTDESDLWRCGYCHHQILRCTHQRFCEECGRKIEWGDVI